MLTHANSSPYGSAMTDAASRSRPPSSSARMPQPRPSVSISRQSASFWFHDAEADSSSAPARSATPSGPIGAPAADPFRAAPSWFAAGPALARLTRRSAGFSVFPIAGREVRGLAEARLASRDPVGDPVDHRADRHARLAEQALRFGGVLEPCGRRFVADQHRRAPEAPAELAGKPADAGVLGAGDVDRRGRRRAVREQPQRLLVGVALPDHVGMAHRQV